MACILERLWPSYGSTRIGTEQPIPDSADDATSPHVRGTANVGIVDALAKTQNTVQFMARAEDERIQPIRPIANKTSPERIVNMNRRFAVIAVGVGMVSMLLTGGSQAYWVSGNHFPTATTDGFLGFHYVPYPYGGDGWTSASYYDPQNSRYMLWYQEAYFQGNPSFYEDDYVESTYVYIGNYWLTYYSEAKSYIIELESPYHAAFGEIYSN